MSLTSSKYASDLEREVASPLIAERSFTRSLVTSILNNTSVIPLVYDPALPWNTWLNFVPSAISYFAASI